MKQFARVIFVLLATTSVRAAESPAFFITTMHLEGADARLMYGAVRVRAQTGADGLGSYTIKSTRIGATDDGENAQVSCMVRADGAEASCDLIWKTAAELKAGSLVTLSESFSQSLVGMLSLLRRPEMSQEWSGLDLSVFKLRCQEIYTPSDLPIYTACSLSIAR